MMRFRKKAKPETLGPTVPVHPLTSNPLLPEHPSSLLPKLFNVSHRSALVAVLIVLGIAGAGTYYLFTSHAAPGPIGIAFEANTNNLWAANSSGVNTGAGMMAGTSPSIASVPGGAEIAFQANTSDLWVTGPLGTVDTHLGMMAGTSPSITYVPGRGYEVAFQANTGNLWLYGQLGTGDQGLGMMAGTNPSIAAVPGGGYAIAFQANTSSLWTVGAFGTKNWGLGMMAGTSPSIAVAANDTYEVAFQANTSDLWSAGSYGAYDYKLGMYAGSSPSIAAIPVSSGSAYEMAFQANTGALWTVGHYGTKNWGLGMYAGSSPSITSFGDGSFNVAFEANTTSLWVLDSTTGAGRDLGLGMHAGTSPSIVVSNMPTPPSDANLGSSLAIGKSIGVGQALYSPNGVFRAVMQGDGNFVVYLNWDELPSWSTGTNGSGANVLNFQSDGNLVVRPSGGAAAWAAGTNTYGGTTLNMQDDGNLVLYNSAGRAMWSWETGKLPPPAVTATIDGPDAVRSNQGPNIIVSSTNATSCSVNGQPVSVNGSVAEPAITATTTYTLTCSGSGPSASDSVTVQVINNTPPTGAGASGGSDSGAAAANSHISLTQPVEGDYGGNWTGFVLSNSRTQFTEVEGSFKVPNFSCPNTPALMSNAAIWIGIDGFGGSSVEQDGIILECQHYKHSGWQKYSDVWWEMFSKHDKQQHFDWGILPGDQINMKVWYNHASNQYGLFLKDLATGQQFTKYESCASGVTCQNLSAEWIVERATFIANGVQKKYPFVDFTPITFTDAQASTNPSYSAYPFSDYPNYPLNILFSPNNYLVSLPSKVYEGTDSFTVDLLREI